MTQLGLEFSGFYIGNNEFTNCVLTLQNKNTYEGGLKDGLPVGEGKLVLYNQLSTYERLCTMSPKYIEVDGFWNDGILDTNDNIAKPFFIIVYLENKSTKDKFYTIIFKDFILHSDYFIPTEEADVFYFKTDDIDPYVKEIDATKLYSAYKGTISNCNKSCGELIYTNPVNHKVSFNGTFKNDMYLEGTVMFDKDFINNSFTGKFRNGIASYGIIKYKDGCEYEGYVNMFFKSYGEGKMNYANQKLCPCCNKGFSEDHKKSKHDHMKLNNIMFDEIEGIWINNELKIEHPISTTCDTCPNDKEIVCLVCKQYYCVKCFHKHNTKRRNKYHDKMMLCIIDEDSDIKELENPLLQKQKEEEAIASKIMTQLTVLNHKLTELEHLEIETAYSEVPIDITQSKKKKPTNKKKKKKHKSKPVKSLLIEPPSCDILTIDDATSFDTTEKYPIAPTHDDYDSSFDDLLKVFKVEYNSDLTKKSK